MLPAVLYRHQHWNDSCSVCRDGAFQCFCWLPAPDWRAVHTQPWPMPASLQPDQRHNWLGYFGEFACRKQGLSTQSPLILWRCCLFYCHTCCFPVTSPGFLFNAVRRKSTWSASLEQGHCFQKHGDTHYLGLYKCLSPSTVLHRSKNFYLLLSTACFKYRHSKNCPGLFCSLHPDLNKEKQLNPNMLQGSYLRI